MGWFLVTSSGWESIVTHSRIGLLLVVLFALIGCDRKQKPETLVEGGYDQAEMAAATQRALNEVDAFIAELQAGTAESFAVKAPISENGQVEHFWLTEVSFDGEKFTGTINNEPGIVTHVKLGQQWSLGKTEISDWLYMRDGKMHGNYTMRPLLATMPEEQAEQFRQMLATP